MPPWQSKFSDSRTRFSRHILYNLTQPEQSLLLLAPLARAAGGYGVCGGNGKAAMGVFATPQDPDYRILFESVLSFLGFGIQPPTPSWGNMLNNAQELVITAPALAVYPGLLIFVTVIAVNFLGDGLQHAFDPRSQR